MTGERLYTALVAHWWMPVVGAWLAALIALGLSIGDQPSFESTAVLTVGPQPSATGNPEAVDSVVDGLDAVTANSGMLVNGFADVLSSQRVVMVAAEQVGVSGADLLEYTITSSRVPESPAVQLSVIGPDAEVAAELAGAITTESQSVFVDVYQLLDVHVLRNPTVAETVGPTMQQRTTVAAAVGAAMGLALALLRDTVRPGSAYAGRPARGTWGRADRTRSSMASQANGHGSDADPERHDEPSSEWMSAEGTARRWG